MDPKAIHDHELSDLLLRRKSFKVWTQPRPHAQTNAMHEKVPWSLNPLGFTCSSNVVAIAISVHQRTESLYNVQRFRASASVVSMQTVQPTSAGASDVKILLDRDDLPKAWYNILPDLPAPFPPYLHPGTKEPVPPQAFEPLFPKELIRQEMSPNRSEPIPDELREAYLRFGRPTPLYRASRLEAFLKTPARIYYKREDLSTVGSHKPNTAISEAIETAVTSPNTRYSLGSVLNHVLMHQTVIGLEAQKQFEVADITPDYMVGSVGGGSNFAGFTYPTIGERIHGRSETRFIAVEPTSVPSMTQGRYEYDFGDTGEMTPLVKMHTLGHTFVPPRIHAGGLRYHGTAATLSVLLDAGLV